VTSAILQQVRQQADQLTPDEQRQLMAYLAEKITQGKPISRHRRWEEICGAAPYPLVGKDAQAWVSELRQESDHHRSQTWNDGQ
jgi:hypothetical protein